MISKRKLMQPKILKHLLLFSLICFIWSCSKTESPESPEPNVNTNLSGELHKMVFIHPGFTDTLEFLYDNAKRVITMNMKSSNTNTMAIHSYTRNSSGQVTSYKYKEPSYNYERLCNYSIANGKFTSTQITIVDGSNTYTGSETFTYTGEFITSIEKHEPPQTAKKSIFSYDNVGNVSMKKVYFESGTLLETIESGYDNKINPFTSLSSPYIFPGGTFYGKNNVTSIKTTSTNHIDVETFIYTYNSSDKPITANVTYVENGSTYHYTIQYIYF